MACTKFVIYDDLAQIIKADFLVMAVNNNTIIINQKEFKVEFNVMSGSSSMSSNRLNNSSSLKVCMVFVG